MGFQVGGRRRLYKDGTREGEPARHRRETEHETRADIQRQPAELLRLPQREAFQRQRRKGGKAAAKPGDKQRA